MKEAKYDTLEGLSAPILVYESIEEAEKSVPGGLLTQANNNMAYRSVLPTVRDIICNLVEEETGVEREKKIIGKAKSGKDLIVWEADGKYVKRAMASKGLEDLKHLQERLDESCRNFVEAVGEGETPGSPEPLAVDLKGTERKAPKSAKLAAKYKLQAAKMITLDRVASANKNQFVKIGKSFSASGDMSKTYTGTFPNGEGQPEVSFTVSDKDAEELGRMVKDYLDWQANEAMKNSF